MLTTNSSEGLSCYREGQLYYLDLCYTNLLFWHKYMCRHDMTRVRVWDLDRILFVSLGHNYNEEVDRAWESTKMEDQVTMTRDRDV